MRFCDSDFILSFFLDMCRWLDFVDEGNMTNQLVVVLLLHLHMDNGISYIILHVYYLLAVRTWCLESVCKKTNMLLKSFKGASQKVQSQKRPIQKGIRPKEPLPKLVYFCRDLTQCMQSTKQLLRYIHAMISFVHGSFWLSPVFLSSPIIFTCLPFFSTQTLPLADLL